jgi:hypothetical protein
VVPGVQYDATENEGPKARSQDHAAQQSKPQIAVSLCESVPISPAVAQKVREILRARGFRQDQY